MASANDLNKQIADLSPAKRALLERMRKRDSGPPPITRRGQQDDLPLSFAQQRLWLIHQLDPESFLYNVPRALRLRGELDLAVLERSLNEIVRRHEVLRTTFVSGPDHPLQKIAATLHVPLSLTDLSGVPVDQHEAEIQRRALEFYRRPFDLARGPLIRACCLGLNEHDHALVLVMHHIVSDGLTGGLLFRELGVIYQALLEGKSSPLPELPVQYADFAVWERGWMHGSALEERLAYWRKHLANAPATLDLPADRLRPSAPGYGGKNSSLLLSKSVSDRLRSFCQRHGVTLFTAVMTALDILLARWSGQNDLVIGTVSANRNQTELESLIGCFVNFLPLRMKVEPRATALELLDQVKQSVLGGFAHQDCPFEKIIEDLNPQRLLNVNPLYNVALLVQNYPEFAFHSESLEARFLNLATEVAFLDLRFLATETANGLLLECEYNTDLFVDATIEALLKNLDLVLDRLTAAPNTLVADFPLLDALIAQAAAARSAQAEQTIAVCATFTAEPLRDSLAFWMRELGVPAEIAFAPYNQIFQQLLDPSSSLARNQRGLNVVLVRLADWLTTAESAPSGTPDAARHLEANIADLVTALKSAAHRSAVPYLICVCPCSRDVLAESSTAELLEAMEERLRVELESEPGLYVVNTAELARLYPVADYEDLYAEQLGHVPYTQPFFNALGTMVARRMYRLQNPPHKVIALDCDNTLWKGICGEDGPLGVEIDPPRRALQEFLLAQREAGMLLCLCSKNNEADAFEVFTRNPGMLLRREHLTSWRINWQAKSDNLRSLADELKLGLESFIFLDDSSMECAEVESRCPEILVLQLPDDIEQLPHFLSHIWAFDHLKVTQEDKKRSALYQENVRREQLRQDSLTLEDFLASLNLKIQISPLQREQIFRVSQLTQRTNQFNCTTVRRTENEIDSLCQAGTMECWVIEVSDRFGEYGLVGVLICSPQGDALYVDTMLLSCRALGRRVEHKMLSHLGSLAERHGLSRVDIPFQATARNQPAFEFLESIGSRYKKEINQAHVYRLPVEVASRAFDQAKSAASSPLTVPQVPAATGTGAL
jgi:FkbH-like protein